MSQTGQRDAFGDVREYTTGGSDLTTWAGNAADWIQIIGAGSTVITTEAGSKAATPYNRTITTDGNELAVGLKCKITALVSTSATRVRLGIGAMPLLSPTAASGVISIASVAAMKALATASNGQIFQSQADGSNWRYAAASTLSDDGGFLVAGATGIGAGAFIRTDRIVDLKLPETYTNADGAILYTFPAGFRCQLGLAWWEPTTGWTGGSSSAIGLHSGTSAAMATKGDVLGGSGGDVAATLVTTGALAKGTVGAKWGNPGSVFVGTDTIVHDRITSAFTAGAGFAHVPVAVLLAPAS